MTQFSHPFGVSGDEGNANFSHSFGVSGSEGVVAAWTPTSLGLKLWLESPLNGQTTGVTLSGSDILTATNLGTAGNLSSSVGKYCKLETSLLLNGYAGIRTDRDTSDLFVASGGPTGTSQFHIIAIQLPISQPNAAHQDSSTLLLGDPGNDASHRNSGLGVVNVLNGAWIFVGGRQNPIGAGSNLPRAIFDTYLHVHEFQNDGTQVIMLRDGGRLGIFSGVTDLSSGRMGFSGNYPLASYGPPDAVNYAVFVADRILTNAERNNLFAYVKTKYALQTRIHRFIGAIGDSITAGHIGGANTTSVIELMKTQYAALGTPEVVDYINQGISSQTTAQILARAQDPTFWEYFAPTGFKEQWLIIKGRTNDTAAGISVAQSYANLVAVNDLAHAHGLKTIIGCVIPAVSMTAQNITDYNTFNSLVLANSGGADAVSDYSSIFTAVPSNTTLLPDNVHPSDAVNAQIATIDRAAIASVTS